MVGAVFMVVVQFAVADAVHRIRQDGTRDTRGHVVHSMGNAQWLRWILFDYRSHRRRLATDGRSKKVTSTKGNPSSIAYVIQHSAILY